MAAQLVFATFSRPFSRPYRAALSGFGSCSALTSGGAGVASQNAVSGEFQHRAASTAVFSQAFR